MVWQFNQYKKKQQILITFLIQHLGGTNSVFIHENSKEKHKDPIIKPLRIRIRPCSTLLHLAANKGPTLHSKVP